MSEETGPQCKQRFGKAPKKGSSNNNKKWHQKGGEHQHKRKFRSSSRFSEEELEKKQRLIEEGLQQQRLKDNQAKSLPVKAFPKVMKVDNQSRIKQLFRNAQLNSPFPSSSSSSSSSDPTSRSSIDFSVVEASPNIIHQLSFSQLNSSSSYWKTHHLIMKRNFGLCNERFSRTEIQENIHSMDYHPSFGYVLNGYYNLFFYNHNLQLKMVQPFQESSSCSWNPFLSTSSSAIPLISPLLAVIHNFTRISFLLPQFSSHSLEVLQTATFQKPISSSLWMNETTMILFTDNIVHQLSIIEDQISIERKALPFLPFDKMLSITAISFVKVIPPNSPSSSLFPWLLLGSRKGNLFVYNITSNQLTKVAKMEFCISQIQILSSLEYLVKDVSGNISVFHFKSRNYTHNHKESLKIQTGHASKLDPSNCWISPDQELVVTTNNMTNISSFSSVSVISTKELSVYSLRHDYCCIRQVSVLKKEDKTEKEQLNSSAATSTTTETPNKILFPSNVLRNQERFCCLVKFSQFSVLVQSDT
jgi:hypothetical protein